MDFIVFSNNTVIITLDCSLSVFSKQYFGHLKQFYFIHILSVTDNIIDYKRLYSSIQTNLDALFCEMIFCIKVINTMH